MSIKTVLVEDVERNLNVLKNILANYCQDVEVLGAAKNVQDGIKLVNEVKPDLLFLDIELPDGTGFDVLRAFNEPDFDVVFTTAYDQYAIKAFKYSALDYLLKPLNIEEVQQVVEKFKKQHQEEEETDKNDRIEFLLEHLQLDDLHSRLVVPSAEGYEFLYLKDVVWLQAANNYTIFHTSYDKQIISSRTMKEYEEILPEHHFFRIHHSYIINMKYIRRYMKGKHAQVVLCDGTTLDIAQRRRDSFLKQYNLK